MLNTHRGTITEIVGKGRMDSVIVATAVSEEVYLQKKNGKFFISIACNLSNRKKKRKCKEKEGKKYRVLLEKKKVIIGRTTTTSRFPFWMLFAMLV